MIRRLDSGKKAGTTAAFWSAQPLLLLLAVVGANGAGTPTPGSPPGAGGGVFAGTRSISYRRAGSSLHDDATEASRNLQAAVKDVPPDFFCHSCQEVSRKVETFLSDPSVYAGANNLSSDICGFMHSALQVQCRELVGLYLQEGILFLQMTFGEENLCNSTGFCPAGNKTDSVLMSYYEDTNSSSSSSSISTPSSAYKSNHVLGKMWKQTLLKLLIISKIERAGVTSKTCNACHAATNQILKDLEDHDQQMRIMEDLLDVCEAFRRYADRCKLVVFEYGPIFLSNVHKFLMTRDVCRFIRMCGQQPAAAAGKRRNGGRRWDYYSRSSEELYTPR